MTLQGGAKIGASIVGFGRDCLHAWELFSQSTYALYQDTGLHVPYPFKDGVHCRYITEDDFPKLAEIIATTLRQDDDRIAVARAGKEHCHKYHSTKARATYLVDVSMKILGGEKLNWEEYGL